MKQSKKRILIEIFIGTLILLLFISSVVFFLLGIWLESKKLGLTGCLALLVICIISLFAVGLNNEEKLQTLHQIKSELEAWEVCKNDPVILSTIKTLAEGESINWHRLPEKQRESIKKVLEVEE